MQRGARTSRHMNIALGAVASDERKLPLCGALAFTQLTHQLRASTSVLAANWCHTRIEKRFGIKTVAKNLLYTMRALDDHLLKVNFNNTSTTRFKRQGNRLSRRRNTLKQISPLNFRHLHALDIVEQQVGIMSQRDQG